MSMKEITPENYLCHTSNCCPAVFAKEDDSYVIIGKKLTAEEQQQLSGRIADDEFVVEVPKGMIDELIAANAK